jgi:putative Mg2+ transporter-C (MgtC) family protein
VRLWLHHFCRVNALQWTGQEGRPHRMSARDLFADPVDFEVMVRLLVSLLVGGLIGLERTYHGRPAGFRSHALVSLSTSLLMLLTFYEPHWFPGLAQGRVVLDPTRMAQGIMTGIGFIGAGTIMREGFSVRGLTTAASLWVTAAIGILVGAGFFFPAFLSTVLTLGTLSVFRWIEAWLPPSIMPTSSCGSLPTQPCRKPSSARC